MAKGKRIQLSNVASVSLIMGLIPAAKKPHDHPLLWLKSDTGQRPKWVRWVWHPRTGDMRLGPVIHHYEFLGKARLPQFNEWVRGFYFPRARLLAVRTYFDPRNPLDEFDASYRDLDEQISHHVVNLLRPILPRVRFVTGVDNAWLENRFPRLCQW